MCLNSFASSLVNNTKLKELILEGDDTPREEVTITNWDALSFVLCNKSSINETFNSNHTLETVSSEWNERHILPSDLRVRALLQLNRDNIEAEASRRKIIDVHFSGDFMQPFIVMELKALPHVIAWVARDEYGSSLLY